MINYTIGASGFVPVAGTGTLSPSSSVPVVRSSGVGSGQVIKGVTPGSGVVQGVTPGSGLAPGQTSYEGKYYLDAQGNASALPPTQPTPIVNDAPSTLTIVNKDTGEVVRQGYNNPNYTGLPSVIGGATNESTFYNNLAAYSKANPSDSNSPINESALSKSLNQPTQTIQQGFMQTGGVSSQTLNEAREILAVPTLSRTPEQNRTLQNAAAISEGYKTEIQKQVYQREMLMPEQQMQISENQVPVIDTSYYARESDITKFRNYDVPIRVIEPFRIQPKLELGYEASKISYYNPVKDINEFEYNKGINLIKSNIDKESGFYKLVLEPNAKFYGEQIENARDNNLNFFDFAKGELATTYDFGTNIAGFVIGKANTFGLGLGDSSLYESKSKGYILPYTSALNIAKGNEQSVIESNISRFYIGKQVAETSLFLIGGAIGVVATVGSVSRINSLDEAAIPIAFGIATRLAVPYITPSLASSVSKANEKLVEYSNKLASKFPVGENVLVADKLRGLLSGENVAKGIILSGYGLELAGQNFVPLEQRYDYIRNVAIYNAVTPIGYKVADVSLMVGKFGALKGLDFVGNVGERFGVDLRLYDKGFEFKELSGTDLTKTPTFVGSENKMLKELQDFSGKPGVSKVFERYNINPNEYGFGSAFRSVSGKLSNYVEPSLVYYEGTKFSFASPVINPISMRGSGLFNKLFTPEPGLYADYQLGFNEPALEFITASKGTSISLGKNVSFTTDVYKEFKSIYGYSEKGLLKNFLGNVTINGIDVPAGTSIGNVEYLKILGGKGTYRADKYSGLARPLKSREIINLIGEKAYESNFIDLKDSFISRETGFFSTPSRSIGATSESEVAIGVARQRIAPLTPLKELGRKLGFADTYVYYNFEAIPINYEVAVSSNLPVIFNKSSSLVLKNNEVGFKTNELVLKNNELVPLNNKLVVASGKMGDYSSELENVFGKKGSPKYSFASSLKYPVVSNKENGYDGSYSSKYVASYDVKYEPSYVPTYTPSYSPKYEPVYEPSYVPKYNPDYTPSYAPKYEPTYEPTYTPIYTPKYEPKYEPKYNPKYSPTYQPIYNPKYDIPYKKNRDIELNNSIKKQLKGYLPQVRKKGKFVNVSEIPVSKELAYSQAANVARSNLTRSIKVKEVGMIEASENNFSLNLQDFRQKKPNSKIIDSPVFVQRNALNSKSETTEIQRAKQVKKMMGM